MGVIPIVNENDTLAVSEIKFGDNDTLSAITAAMVHADVLFLMTDVDCLYDKNPRTHPDAHPIEVVEDIGSLVADGESFRFTSKYRPKLISSLVSTAGSSLGTGGMSTKIVAARLATSAGVTTVITRSSNPGNIVKIVKHIQASRSPPSLVTKANQTASSSVAEAAAAVANRDRTAQHTAEQETSQACTSHAGLPPATDKIPLHTRFLPSPHPVRDRYFWILHGLRPHGTLYIDQGAYKALLGKAGLLPVGVVDVEGSFAQHEAVRICVVERKKKEKGQRRDRKEKKPKCGNGQGDGGPQSNGGENEEEEKKKESESPGVEPGGEEVGGEIEDSDDDGKLWEGEPREVGRALSNYSSSEIARIKGRQSAEVEGILGYADSEYVAQRESISFFDSIRGSRPATPVREVLEGKGIGGYEAEKTVL